MTGEIWNPTDKTINSVIVKSELWDKAQDKMLWNKESKIVDEFVPPFLPKQARSFEFLAPDTVKADGEYEFRVYLNGSFYKSYLLGKADKKRSNVQDSAPPAIAGSGTSPNTEANVINKPIQTNIPKVESLPGPSARSESFQ